MFYGISPEQAAALFFLTVTAGVLGIPWLTDVLMHWAGVPLRIREKVYWVTVPAGLAVGSLLAYKNFLHLVWPQ